MRQLLQKFDNGEALTDRELAELNDKLTQALEALKAVNYEPYWLTLKDIRMKLMTVNDYQEARRRR